MSDEATCIHCGHVESDHAPQTDGSACGALTRTGTGCYCRGFRPTIVDALRAEVTRLTAERDYMAGYQADLAAIDRVLDQCDAPHDPEDGASLSPKRIRLLAEQRDEAQKHAATWKALAKRLRGVVAWRDEIDEMNCQARRESDFEHHRLFDALGETRIYRDRWKALAKLLHSEAKALESARSAMARVDELCDCGDNSCRFARHKGGMRTNGGCRCAEGRPGVMPALSRLVKATRAALAKRDGEE